MFSSNMSLYLYVCMNEWMDLRVFFATSRSISALVVHTGTEKSKEIFHPNSDPKMLLFVVGPNNVSLLTLEPGNDYITPTSVQ